MDNKELSPAEVLSLEVVDRDVTTYHFEFNGVKSYLRVKPINKLAEMTDFRNRVASFTARKNKSFPGWDSYDDTDLALIAFLNVFGDDEVFRKTSSCMKYIDKFGIPVLTIFSKFMSSIGLATTDADLEEEAAKFNSDTFLADDDN